jgi:cystathionine beta-lyase
MPPVFKLHILQPAQETYIVVIKGSRTANPTRTALEEALASIGKMALEVWLIRISCDRLFVAFFKGVTNTMDETVYGGTYRFTCGYGKKLGIKFHYVNMNDLTSFSH